MMIKWVTLGGGQNKTFDWVILGLEINISEFVLFCILIYLKNAPLKFKLKLSAVPCQEPKLALVSSVTACGVLSSLPHMGGVP